MAEMTMALRAAHFQLQYLEGFLRLKAGRAKVLRGRGRGGGEYTVLDVRGYPGDVVQKRGEVPPGLKRKCLWIEKSQRVSGSAGLPEIQIDQEDRGSSRRSMQRSLERERERESLQRRQRGRKKENHVPDHKTEHTKTCFHGTRMGQACPRGKPPKLRQKVLPTR